MATQANPERLRLESEYRAWSNLCLDKHGLPWMIKEDEIATVDDFVLLAALKELKVLGRTPHEG